VTRWTTLCFSFFLATACDEAAPATDSGTGGECESLWLVCPELDESECEQREGCIAVSAQTWDGDLDACIRRLGTRVFVTCAAGGVVEACTTAYTAPGCIWHPSDAQRCFCDGSTTDLPGWEHAIECETPPGTCGN
jgi:hypothetical protein